MSATDAVLHSGRIECGLDQIEAVFLDIDGTIVYDSKVVPSVVEAIGELQQRGFRVALCTGRSILHTTHIQHQLAVESAVYFNGGLALLKDIALTSHPLAPVVVRRISSFAQENHLPYILHTVEKTVVFEQIPKTLEPLLRAFDFPPLSVEDPQTWQDTHQDVYQVNVFMDKRWEQTVQNQIPECLIYRWADQAVDLQKRGCDKSVGAMALLETWNIAPENALHIGDGGNDVGMFKTMGHSVAMGNAPEEVKQYAKMTTERVENNGVYHALKKLELL
jgi:Cof subfamily protein (haloacid dehalogenase superfamily)